MALTRPSLVTQYALTTPVTADVTLPVNLGRRPYSHLTKAGQPVRLRWDRIAGGTAATFAAFGVDLTYDGSPFGFDGNGRVLPGYAPGSAPLNLNGVTPNGCYREKVRISGGSATTLGHIAILDGGSGYTSAPAISFSGITGSPAATALISADGRVVGAVITNAGTVVSSTATITIAAPTNGRQARAAICVGQQATVQTHIPFATYAPTTVGGAYWVAMWKDRLLACSTSLLDAAATAGIGLDGDNQFAEGFTVATGTHADGTTTIGVLTLARGLPNGSEITVYRGTVQQLLALGTAAGALDLAIKAPTLAYIGCATGAADTGTINAVIEPVAST